MKIRQLKINNIRGIDADIPTDTSVGISGWSGSGKSSFCQAIAAEAIKRLVTILPKSQYSFVFPDLLKTNFGALQCNNLPCIEFLDNQPATSNARSTIGTHTSLLKEIRNCFARATGQPSEFFSFNTPLAWCTSCKGRGALNDIVCSECSGLRYSPAVNEFHLPLDENKIDISTANGFSLAEVLVFANELGLSCVGKKVAQNAVDLGIGYLGLNRTISTLSGGEYTRLLLSERLGLSARMLFVLDEPGLGLDAKTTKLLLSRIADLGKKNQLYIVDHSQQVLSAAETHLHFGPGSGSNGGVLVKKATVIPPVVPSHSDPFLTTLDLCGLHCRNISIDNLSLPTGAIVAFTGESGSGKTTLLRDLIAPKLYECFGADSFVFIGQGRSKAMTSLSTLATFLGVTSWLRSTLRTKGQPCTFCNGTGKIEETTDCILCMATGMNPEFYQALIWNEMSVGELLQRPISEIADAFSSGTRVRTMLDFLIRLGAGYLSLERKTRTLSTGEFQRVHLAREFAAEQVSKQARFFLLDEPSRGLSQNYLNSFASLLRELVNANGSTVYLIEHNAYFLDCADFVVDFGLRKPLVTDLTVLDNKAWAARQCENMSSPKILHSQFDVKPGLSIAGTSPLERHEFWHSAVREFNAGILRTLSSTARWIYGVEDSPAKVATIALDFERMLYSEDTFLFEICDLAGRLTQYSGKPVEELAYFDYMDRSRLCRCCRGTGQVETFDLDLVMSNPSKGLWKGMLHKEVMSAIRKWNFDKIKFLFAEIKTTTGLDLARAREDMSYEEQKVLWYGLWNRSFRWREKGSVYIWRGLDALIRKYIRYASGELKKAINESKCYIECPICEGDLLNHSVPLSVAGIDIRQLLRGSLTETIKLVADEPILHELIKVAPVGTKLDDRPAFWPWSNQVRLKLLELRLKQLICYRFVFRNLAPWVPFHALDLQKLALKNEVILCDGEDEKESIEAMLSRHSLAKPSVLVRDFIGFSTASRELRRLRKTAICSFCQGKGFFEVERPEDGLERVKTPCDACFGEGLNTEAIETLVVGAPARVWLQGTIGEIPTTLYSGDPQLQKIPLSSKLSQLPKYQLALLLASVNNKLVKKTVK